MGEEVQALLSLYDAWHGRGHKCSTSFHDVADVLASIEAPDPVLDLWVSITEEDDNAHSDDGAHPVTTSSRAVLPVDFDVIRVHFQAKPTLKDPEKHAERQKAVLQLVSRAAMVSVDSALLCTSLPSQMTQNLQSLALGWQAMSPEASGLLFRAAAQCTNLRMLQCPITFDDDIPEFKSLLSKLPRLVMLEVDDHVLSTDAAAAISSLHQLRVLSLHACSKKTLHRLKGVLDALLSLCGVQVLALSGVTLDAVTAGFIMSIGAQWRDLLSVRVTSFPPRSGAIISPVLRGAVPAGAIPLQHLVLEDKPSLGMLHAVLALAKRAPHLQHLFLNLGEDELSLDVVQALAEVAQVAPELKTNVFHCPVAMDQQSTALAITDILARAPHLLHQLDARDWDLQSPQLQTRLVDVLSQAHGMHSLNLVARLSAAGTLDLTTRALPQMTLLRGLFLDEVEMGDAAAMALAEAVPQMRSLGYLHISRNSFSSKPLGPLVRALLTLPSFQTLSCMPPRAQPLDVHYIWPVSVLTASWLVKTQDAVLLGRNPVVVRHPHQPAVCVDDVGAVPALFDLAAESVVTTGKQPAPGTVPQDVMPQQLVQRMQQCAVCHHWRRADRSVLAARVHRQLSGGRRIVTTAYVCLQCAAAHPLVDPPASLIA